MNSNFPIKQLSDLQEVDGEILTRQKELDDVRAKLADNSAVQSAQLTLQKVESQLSDQTSIRRGIEPGVQQISEKIQAVDGRLYGGSITNPRELSAYQEEKVMLEKQAAAEEEKLLDVMVQIEDLQNSIGTLASSLYSDQALQASALIDREVLVARDVGPLGSDRELRGAVELASSTGSVEVRVTDANGVLVRRLDLGQQQGGLVRFVWDGRDESGQPMLVGNYRLEAFAVQTGVREQVPVLVESRVESVTLGNSGGVLLNLEGLGEVALGEVRRIGSSSPDD